MDRSVAGIILAGGQSRRMGGGDKPLLSLGKARLIDHVAARLKSQVGTLALNANGDPARFAGTDLPVLADTIPDYAGPLAGVLTGLEWAATSTTCWALVTAAGDTPFFPCSLVERLAAAARARPGAIAVATSDGRWHPTFALWPLGLRDALRHFLVDEDNRRVSAFIERHGFVAVEFPMLEAGNERIDPFFNINTPDDLAKAERLLQSVSAMRRVFGITGWKNSGKTTLTEKLVAELVRRGWTVSTVKHAHHDFDIDKPDTDSFRHRQAGAMEVAIVSSRRWALMHELRNADEPKLDEILARLAPSDIVLVEGYKREAHKKIEARRLDAKDRTPLAAGDAQIVAIAADFKIESETLPVFDLDDTKSIADFIERTTGLVTPGK